jgi:hypothetical protein
MKLQIRRGLVYMSTLLELDMEYAHIPAQAKKATREA